MDDIYIRDDVMNEVSKTCKRKSDEYIKLINDFKSIVQKILADGVKSGEFHDKIEAFIKMFDGMDKEVDEINSEISKQIKKFLSDFEKADGDLY